jgi:hypothetical protein
LSRRTAFVVTSRFSQPVNVRVEAIGRKTSDSDKMKEFVVIEGIGMGTSLDRLRVKHPSFSC